jgi:excisionase family DNA binding protein
LETLFMTETPPPVDRDFNELLSVEQVSKELSVHPVTVRHWINRGLLPASKAGRRKWMVRRQALQDFLERGDASEATVADRYAPPTDLAAGVIDTLTPREGAS